MWPGLSDQSARMCKHRSNYSRVQKHKHVLRRWFQSRCNAVQKLVIFWLAGVSKTVLLLRYLGMLDLVLVLNQVWLSLPLVWMLPRTGA
ncbi:Uncharacterised protein [Klebsiella michiganensis]|nr:Uncharacterised protein [Klebsiella michiganensis]